MKIFILVSLFASLARAEYSKVQNFDCLIKSFDANHLTVRCDDFKSDMKLPRNLITPQEDKKLVSGQKLKIYMALDDINSYVVEKK